MIVAFITFPESILLLFMISHDWISVPPLNNIAALKSADSDFYQISGSCIIGDDKVHFEMLAYSSEGNKHTCRICLC